VLAEPLRGGRTALGAVRIGETVRRPATPNSVFVRSLLMHLEQSGLHATRSSAQAFPWHSSISMRLARVRAPSAWDTPHGYGWIGEIRTCLRLIRSGGCASFSPHTVQNRRRPTSLSRRSVARPFSWQQVFGRATRSWRNGPRYHRTVHREIGCTPLERFLAGPNVGRECPGSAAYEMPSASRSNAGNAAPMAPSLFTVNA